MNPKIKMTLAAVLLLAAITATGQVRRSTTSRSSTTTTTSRSSSTTSRSSSSAATPSRSSSATTANPSTQAVRRSTSADSGDKAVRRSTSAESAEKSARQQEKVDRQQQPTNIVNQPETHREVTKAAQNQRRNRPQTTQSAGKSTQPQSGSSTQPGKNGQPQSGSNTQPGKNGQPTGQSGQITRNRPVQGQVANDTRNPGARPAAEKKPTARPVLPPRPAHTASMRPLPPPVPHLTRAQIRHRTNASRIVVLTDFATRAEAFDYLVNLLYDRYYDVASYNPYRTLSTAVTLIPTPLGWTRPDTHNEFRMHFSVGKRCGRIRVTITAEWRESVLADYFTGLRYQPSDRYSTYYAWNVLEDIASAIPHSRIDFLR